MDEGESSRADAAGGQSKDKGKGKSKTTITSNKAPEPSVDVTRTKVWASLQSDSVDLGTAVTHQNLEIIAELCQNITGLMVEVAKSLSDLNKKCNKQTADINALKDELGVGSANSSRRSSLGSAGRRSSAREGTVDETEISPFDDVVSQLPFLDEFFESFLQEGTHKPLIKRSNNVEKSGDEFIEAARQSLAGVLGDNNAEAINQALNKLVGIEISEVYIALSKRFRQNKSKGEKVATVTESFETDMAGGGDGSQST
ncbi:hypothetical protein ACHAPU_002503 [Fusarium lateritium]